MKTNFYGDVQKTEATLFVNYKVKYLSFNISEEQDIKIHQSFTPISIQDHSILNKMGTLRVSSIFGITGGEPKNKSKSLNKVISTLIHSETIINEQS